MMQTVTEVSTLIWIGSMLLISMLLYLVFELFDPSGITNGDRRNGQKSLLLRLRSYWRQQKRLRQVLKLLLQTVLYKRLNMRGNGKMKKSLRLLCGQH